MVDAQKLPRKHSTRRSWSGSVGSGDPDAVRPALNDYRLKAVDSARDRKSQPRRLRAVDALRAKGFRNSDISFVAPQGIGDFRTDGHRRNFVDPRDQRGGQRARGGSTCGIRTGATETSSGTVTLIMRQGTAASQPAVWERYATVDLARAAVRGMYHDDRVLRALIVTDEVPSRFVEWVER